MLNMQPLIARAVGLIVFLPSVILMVYVIRSITFAICDALGLPSLSPTLPLWCFLAFRMLFRGMYLPIRRQLAIFAYIRWLRSFGDEDMSDGRRTIGRTMLRYLRHYAPPWRGSRGSSEELVEEGQIRLR